MPEPGHAHLMDQLQQVAKGLAATFAPFCEVVVHDLDDPDHAIVAIENNLSGRRVGDPATELGLARLADDAYPQVVANYPNRFGDGRRVKSTSIGVKDERGHYAAALCLNVDMTVFDGIGTVLDHFGRTGTAAPAESLDPANADVIRARIDAFAADRATTPRALRTAQRRELVRELKSLGFMEVRRSAGIVADHLGVSRATVYADAK